MEAFGRTQRAAGQENGGEQVGCGHSAKPKRAAGQAHAAVELAAHPPTGDRNHRARGRAPAPAAQRPPNHRSDDPARGAPPPHAVVVDPRASASSRRPASAGLRTNGPIGTAGSTARAVRTARCPTGTACSTARITRSAGAYRADDDPRPQWSPCRARATRPRPGSTTSNSPRCGPDESRGSAKTSVSLAVVTGCTMSNPCSAGAASSTPRTKISGTDAPDVTPTV